MEYIIYTYYISVFLWDIYVYIYTNICMGYSNPKNNDLMMFQSDVMGL